MRGVHSISCSSKLGMHVTTPPQHSSNPELRRTPRHSSFSFPGALSRPQHSLHFKDVHDTINGMLNGAHHNYGSFQASSQPRDDQSGVSLPVAPPADTAASGAHLPVMDRDETYLQSQPLLHDEWRTTQHPQHTAPTSRHSRRFPGAPGSNIGTPSSRSPGLASATTGNGTIGPETPPLKGYRYMANGCGSGTTSPSTTTDTTLGAQSPQGTNNTSLASTGVTGSLYGSNLADSSGASGPVGPRLLNGGVGHEATEANDMIRLEVGEVPPPRFPPEKLKTLVAFVWMLLNFLLTLTSLALTHERVPDDRPLPDIVLDNVPTLDWALTVSESIILILVYSAFIGVILHRHRMIVLRRIFMIMGLLYMMRSVTYFVTVLPKPNLHYPCAPKAGVNLTAGVVVTRVLKLLTGFGLSINGQHVYCGDYIYSGHTVTLTMAYLVIKEYTPRHWWPLHWCAMLLAATGVVMLLISRGHYTVDVLIAYFFTSRVFWMYHVMANNNFLKERGGNNYLSRLWWHRAFRYFECNVSAPLPRHYQWPLPWPRCFLTKRPERIS